MGTFRLGCAICGSHCYSGMLGRASGGWEISGSVERARGDRCMVDIRIGGQAGIVGGQEVTRWDRAEGFAKKRRGGVEKICKYAWKEAKGERRGSRKEA